MSSRVTEGRAVVIAGLQQRIAELEATVANQKRLLETCHAESDSKGQCISGLECEIGRAVSRIAELEAENKMLSAATRSVEDWEMERGFRARAERRVKELEAEVERLREQDQLLFGAAAAVITTLDTANQYETIRGRLERAAIDAARSK